jgi:hypothetical protein
MFFKVFSGSLAAGEGVAEEVVDKPTQQAERCSVSNTLRWRGAGLTLLPSWMCTHGSC